MKEARLKQRISRKELAFTVGCSYSMICKIEIGVKTPSLPMANRIARALGTTVDALFYA